MRTRPLMFALMIVFSVVFLCCTFVMAKSVQPTRVLKGHTKDIYALAISHKGDFAITASRDKTLKVWDLPGGRLLATLKGHTSRVTTVAISPGDRLALSASQDTSIKLWDIRQGKELKTIKGHKGYANHLAIAPNGKYFVLGSEKKLQLYSFPQGKLIKDFPGNTAQVLCMAIIPNSRYMVSGHLDKTFRIWRLPGCKFLGNLKKFDSPVLSLAISQNGYYRLLGLKEYTRHQKKYPSLKYWRVKEKKLRTYKNVTARITAVGLDPDLKFMLMADAFNKLIQIRTLKKGKLIRNLKGHKGTPLCLGITPDGSYALSGDDKGGLLLWKMPKSSTKAKKQQVRPTKAKTPPKAGLRYQRLGSFIVPVIKGWKRGSAAQEKQAGCKLLFYTPKGGDPEKDQVIAAFFNLVETFSNNFEREMLEDVKITKVKSENKKGFRYGHVTLRGKPTLWLRNHDSKDTFTYVFPYGKKKFLSLMFFVPGSDKRLPDQAKKLLANIKVIED